VGEGRVEQFLHGGDADRFVAVPGLALEQQREGR
jgi:hypothetical protein